MRLNIGENIKKWRTERKMTQEQLSEALGITFQCISRWERGEGYPDITMLPSVAAFFNVTVDELLGTDKDKDSDKINKYIGLYNSTSPSDLNELYTAFKAAVKEFPLEHKLLVRYMNLLHEEKIRQLSYDSVQEGGYIPYSDEITGIYSRILKYCKDDSIRIWAKNIMITHLLWKRDCCPDRKENDSYSEEAKRIAETLPSMENSRELISSMISCDKDFQIKALEEILFLLQKEMYGYIFEASVNKKTEYFEAVITLMKLIYSEGDFGKNSFHRLYSLGHLSQLYHQKGDNETALFYLKKAVEFAKELDNAPESTEKIKRFYNYGPEYRELSASQFMKEVITNHYCLSDGFRSSQEFKTIISLLG